MNAANGSAPVQLDLEPAADKSPPDAHGELAAETSLADLGSDERAKEVADRLRIGSPGLAKELHDISLRRLEDEDRRKTGLEAKAAGLLQAVGISLALMTAFGGAIIVEPDFVSVLGSAVWLVRLFLLLAVLAGVTAAVCALLAQMVTEYRTIGDDDVFNRESLRQADSRSDPDDASTDGRAVAYYHRYMALAHWRVYWYVFELHKKKAKIVWYGQVCFVALLISFLLLGATIVLGARQTAGPTELGPAEIAATGRSAPISILTSTVAAGESP